MYYAAFVRFPWGTMTLRISCRALEYICLSVCHYLRVLFCLSMQDPYFVSLCVYASECVFLYVRTCVHQDMGPILCLFMSLCRFIPLYQENEKCNEGEILTLPS